MRQSGRRDTASARDVRETRRRPRLLAVIVLVAAAIALIVVGLTTSSSDGTQKIKGPVPYTVLTTVPGETGSSSVSTSTSSAASASANTSNSATASALRNSAASANPAVSASSVGSGGAVSQVGIGEGSAGDDAVLPDTMPADATAVHVPILMYHYVDAIPAPVGTLGSALTVRTGDFKAEMDYLAQNGYHTVSLGEVYRAMVGLTSLPARPVALTFDDGGLDNYSVAFPILKSQGFTATFFVITSYVGKSGSMDWDDLRDMASQGMFIGSHTETHPNLVSVSANRLQSELVDSRAAIDRELGETDYVLAYPNGAFDSQVIAAARAAGYLMAVSTHTGSLDDPKALFEMVRREVPAFMSLGSFAKLVQ